MAKEQPQHYDRIGRQVDVGDIVAVADFNVWRVRISLARRISAKVIKSGMTAVKSDRPR